MGAWTKEKFDEAVMTAKRMAEKALRTSGQTDVMLSTAHILGNVNPETKAVEAYDMIIGFMDSDPEAKARNTNLIRQLCRDLDAEGIVIVTETWTRDVSPENLRKTFPNAPKDTAALNTWIMNNMAKVRDKVPPGEAVMITAHFHQKFEQHMLRFTRSSSNKPILGKWEKHERDEISLASCRTFPAATSFATRSTSTTASV